MTTDLLYIKLACHVCKSHQFQERKSLHRHYARAEKITLPSPPKGNPYYSIQLGIETTEVEANATISRYACPSCNDLLEDMKELAEHVDSVHVGDNDQQSNYDVSGLLSTDGNKEEDEARNQEEGIDNFSEEEFISESYEEFPAVKTDLQLTLPETINTNKPIKKKRRTYDDAITSACQQKGTPAERNKTIYILDTLNLKPFSIIDNSGKEENALAHSDVISKLVNSHDVVKPVPIIKRSYEDAVGVSSSCINCTSNIPDDLVNLIDSSPYVSLLKQREYAPLTNELCTLLNKDWEFYPQVKYFSAALFAGSIIVNTTNNKAIMVNTVEVYGRTKAVDYHREPFGKLKNSVLNHSLPPPIKTHHKNVWPTTLDVRDGKKLVIGTHVSNALITSSIRLDDKNNISVGATTYNFSLETLQDSLATKIFIDMESLTTAKELIENSSATSVSEIGIIFHQLRQIRTKFHLPSTYSLCRASGPITVSHTCHPFSLFTLSEFDRGRSVSAAIFRTIASEILINSSKNPKLHKEKVVDWMEESKGKVKEILQNVINLYNGDEADISIFYNASLNKELEALAVLLTPQIADSNKSVEAEIKHVFEVYSFL